MTTDTEDGFSIDARWVGKGFQPTHDGAALCQTKLRPWEVVRITIHQGRSMKSHRHMFPWLNDAWLSLPEEYRDAPWAASPEHLRKHALIKTGFHNAQLIPVDSEAEAMRWSAILSKLDPYALLIPKPGLVLHYTAMSQSVKAMGKERFAASKQAVLGHVADLLGIYPEELAQWGRKLKGKSND